MKNQFLMNEYIPLGYTLYVLRISKNVILTFSNNFSHPAKITLAFCYQHLSLLLDKKYLRNFDVICVDFPR